MKGRRRLQLMGGVVRHLLLPLRVQIQDLMTDVFKKEKSRPEVKRVLGSNYDDGGTFCPIQNYFLSKAVLRITIIIPPYTTTTFICNRFLKRSFTPPVYSQRTLEVAYLQC